MTKLTMEARKHLHQKSKKKTNIGIKIKTIFFRGGAKEAFVWSPSQSTTPLRELTLKGALGSAVSVILWMNSPLKMLSESYRTSDCFKTPDLPWPKV